ncbi:hypothetical protein [Spirosoma validum]|uniref:Uncharacterized protein n=1 Tax=Spirosoma validum TaxID=2771355 RepID=A0A927B5H0_9BACT|nr:hypothetical protein [Spirosoma validum]MBD2755597.1 hypothetical protein [Spirosoma validum]
MKIPNVVTIVALTASVGLDACREETVRTAIYSSVNISVLGDSLTDYYTIRVPNSDTIHYGNARRDNTTSYVVLDDSYQSALANSQDRFRFVGEINNAVVVDEEYVIKADECHISKVSGKEEVQL